MISNAEHLLVRQTTNFWCSYCSQVPVMQTGVCMRNRWEAPAINYTVLFTV